MPMAPPRGEKDCYMGKNKFQDSQIQDICPKEKKCVWQALHPYFKDVLVGEVCKKPGEDL